MSPTLDLRHRQSPIKDQGRRGTCVACAATAGHEMLRSEGVELSVEFLHWASKQRDGLSKTSEGTTLVAAAESLSQVGQPPESCWLYDENRDQWAFDYSPPPAASAAAPARRTTNGDMLPPTPAALRDALDRGRAVLLGVRLHMPWFEVEADGQIEMPAAGALDFGGHAVLIVGYQDDTLIVRNSWGADWDDEGFAYLPDAYVDAFGVSAWTLAP